MKKAGWSVVGLAAGLLTAVPAFANFNYSKVPVFWSAGTQPNVMLLLDDSGSMADPPAGSAVGTEAKITTMKRVAKQVVTDNASKMRIGMFHFSGSYGGTLSNNCGTSATTINASIDALTASNWTPLGSALYEVTRYFRGMPASSTSGTPGTTYTSPIQYRCQKNFTVLLTDGKPTKGIENPGSGISDGSLPPAATLNDTQTGGVTNPWGAAYTLDTAGKGWDGYPDAKMSGDSNGYYPMTDDIAQFAYDIDMKTSTTASTAGVCPTGSVGQAQGEDCAGKSWQDDDANATGEFAQQNMVTYTIGFDVQNEMLNDAPLLATTSFGASQVHIAAETVGGKSYQADTITIPDHGMQTGDYVQYYNPRLNGVATGLGDTTNEWVNVNSLTGLSNGMAVAYSDQGGTTLQYSVTTPASGPYNVTESPNTDQVCLNSGVDGTGTNQACSPVNTVEMNTATISSGLSGGATRMQATYKAGKCSGSPCTPTIKFLNGTTFGGTTCSTRSGCSLANNATVYLEIVQPSATVGNVIIWDAATGGNQFKFAGAGNNRQSFAYSYSIPASTVNNTASTYYAYIYDTVTPRIKLALTQADALVAGCPACVNIAVAGNASQTFSFSYAGTGVGGLMAYETDLEQAVGSTGCVNATTNTSCSRGKYCVIYVDKDNFKLAQAYTGGYSATNKSICPATATALDLTSTGSGGMISSGPGKAYYSTDATTLSKSLNAAFDSINEKNLSFGGVSANSSTLNTNTRVYQASFNTKSWSSTISAYPFVNGVLNSTSTWGTMDTLIPVPRSIITYKPSTAAGVNFLYANLDASQQQAVSGSATANSTTGGYVIYWMQGNPVTGYRSRTNTQLLGDIIDSGLTYVGADDDGYTSLPAAQGGGTPYANFLSAKASWTPMVYAGANDGMVHGFQAADGVEKMAFVPNGTYVDWNDANSDGLVTAGETVDYKLFNLTQQNYTHRYFVNGVPTVGDAYLGGAWRTVMVGGLAQGGRSIYALNVMGNFSVNPASSSSRVMWEFGSWNNKEVGYTFGTPTIAQVKDSSVTGGIRWVAIFGNGYDSASKKAQLFIVDLLTGALVGNPIDTGSGSSTSSNGLSQPAVVLDSNKVVQYVYAGDLLGNVWKFDLTSSSTSSWSASKFFTTRDTAGNAQPITAGVAVGTNPDNNKTMVYVVTGKYFEPADSAYTSTSVPRVQTIYGLEDDGSGTALGTLDRTASKLVKQTFGSVTINGKDYRTITNASIDYAGSQRGWYLDMDGAAYAGEMGINTPIVHGDRLILTSIIPSNPTLDPCVGVGGDGELIELQAVKATVDATQGFFDINGDGVVDANEKLVVGQTLGGIPSNPTILTSPDGKWEIKVGSKASTSGSFYQAKETPPKDNSSNPATGRMSWRQLQ